MKTRTLCIAALLFAASTLAFADSPHDPAITEARAEGGMLHILGLNLSGARPQVTLGTLPLSVVSMTPTQIDALVPANVVPGSYLLTVTLGKSKSVSDGLKDDAKSDEFWVTIGAAGQQGPAGTAGLQGAMGPIGPQGIPGVAGAAGRDGASGAQGPIGPQGMPGPAGASGALSSIEALAGLACNVVNARDVCQGVTAITFDAATNGLGFFCQPSGERPTLHLVYDLRGLHQGQTVRVLSNPYSNLSRSLLTFSSNSSLSESTCPGAVNVFTFILGVSQLVQAPQSLTVNGGSCSGVVLLPNSSVECTVTMDGDQFIRIQ
jgi:hypothetical protein